MAAYVGVLTADARHADMDLRELLDGAEELDAFFAEHGEVLTEIRDGLREEAE